jgi:hypothetical protein
LSINDLLGSGSSEDAKVVLAGIDIDEMVEPNTIEQTGKIEKCNEKVEIKAG